MLKLRYQLKNNMYFHRAENLDPPDWMRKSIVQQLDQGQVTETKMGYHYPPKDQVLAKVTQRPDLIEYVERTYGTNHTQGYTLTTDLTQQITDYYSDFLSLVPDQARISVVQTTSTVDYMLLHIDQGKTASLTCVVCTDGRPRTTWWEPKPYLAARLSDHSDPWRFQKVGSIYPGDADPCAASWLEPWQMILFDNNTPHSVEEFVVNGSRTLFTISFLNTTFDELFQTYIKWTKLKGL